MSIYKKSYGWVKCKCPILNKNVSIFINWDDRYNRRLSKYSFTTCELSLECGVGMINGNAVSQSWDKCPVAEDVEKYLHIDPAKGLCIIPELKKCPYCKKMINPKKFRKHRCKQNFTQKKLNNISKTLTFQIIGRCKFCNAPSMAGSNICYSCSTK